MRSSDSPPDGGCTPVHTLRRSVPPFARHKTRRSASSRNVWAAVQLPPGTVNALGHTSYAGRGHVPRPHRLASAGVPVRYPQRQSGDGGVAVRLICQRYASVAGRGLHPRPHVAPVCTAEGYKLCTGGNDDPCGLLFVHTRFFCAVLFVRLFVHVGNLYDSMLGAIWVCIYV